MDDELGGGERLRRIMAALGLSTEEVATAMGQVLGKPYTAASVRTVFGTKVLRHDTMVNYVAAVNQVLRQRGSPHTVSVDQLRAGNPIVMATPQELAIRMVHAEVVDEVANRVVSRLLALAQGEQNEVPLLNLQLDEQGRLAVTGATVVVPAYLTEQVGQRSELAAYKMPMFDDSMLGEGLRSGALVVVALRAKPRDGDIVLVAVGTVLRLRRVTSGQLWTAPCDRLPAVEENVPLDAVLGVAVVSILRMR
jgi:SOS-response transcriptional repressor LexA